jgi:hypothetical protein
LFFTLNTMFTSCYLEERYEVLLYKVYKCFYRTSWKLDNNLFFLKPLSINHLFYLKNFAIKTKNFCWYFDRTSLEYKLFENFIWKSMMNKAWKTNQQKTNNKNNNKKQRKVLYSLCYPNFIWPNLSSLTICENQ